MVFLHPLVPISIDVIDNSHYITQGLSIEPLQIFVSASHDLHYLTGSIGPDIGPDVSVLAELAGQPSLVTFARGDLMLNGHIAKGRRVILPWGEDDMEFSVLNDAGKKIMQRSIEWAMGAGLDRRRHLVKNFTKCDANSPSPGQSHVPAQDGCSHRHLQEENDPSFDGTLLSSILMSNFSGASGSIAFGKEYEKGRNYEGIKVGLYNIRPQQVNPETGKRGHEAFFISIWKEGVGWVDVPGTNLVYRDGSTVFPGMYRRVFDANYITPVVRAIGLGLMLFVWLIAVVSIVLLGWLRNDPIVQRAQPFFMQLLCVGSIITSTTMFTLSFDEDAGWTNRQLSRACSLTPWFFFTGHILIFCSLFIKLWRVDRVLQVQQRTAITVYKALWPLVVFLIVALLILLAQTLYDPWSWERHIINEIPAETYGKCQSSHTWAFFGLLIGLVFVAEATTLYFAWKTADLPGDFRDSEAVMYACMAQIQSWVVGVPMMLMLGHSSADATYFARILLIWIFAVSGIVVVVDSKIVKAIKNRRKPDLGSGGRRVSIAGIYHSSKEDHSISQYGYQDQSFTGALDSSFSETLHERKRATARQCPPQPMISPTELKQIQEEDSSSLEMKEEDSLDPDPYYDYIHGERVLV